VFAGDFMIENNISLHKSSRLRVIARQPLCFGVVINNSRLDLCKVTPILLTHLDKHVLKQLEIIQEKRT
jgi:hypothetical protein